MSRVCLAVVLAAISFVPFSASSLGGQRGGGCVYGKWEWQEERGGYMQKMTLPKGGVRFFYLFEREREWIYVLNPSNPSRWTARYPTKYNADCKMPQVAAELCPEEKDPCLAEWGLPPAPGARLEAQDRDGRMIRVSPPKDLPPGI